jgi:hypothetical protein
MRSITKSSANKNRFNQLLVGILLIFIMFLSVLGYALSGKVDEDADKEKVVYNGMEFINQNGFWVTKVENFQFVFRYNPNEVPKVYSFVNFANTYYEKPLYIQSDEEVATSEIYNNLNQIVERMQPACLDKGEDTVCEGDFPIKDCNNNFIIIQESNITDIVQNQSCVFIQGPREDLVEITDEFLFKILGIEQY